MNQRVEQVTEGSRLRSCLRIRLQGMVKVPGCMGWVEGQAWMAMSDVEIVGTWVFGNG